jgi:F0F1-type ATP synthase gamma subunit
MKKVLKDLLKFVWLLRADAINSLNWVSGLVFIKVTELVVTSKLLKTKRLFKFFKQYFHPILTLFSTLFYAAREVLLSYLEMGY